ncbi:hypothetical protein [Streptosporangium minutum]|uniref:hypothetical protein n=1 Tax=Streptosporangium minutum TaxID=569862 RepID=UPI001054C684|nr:hypothetical protein [Streptosporangium minutum]
MPAPIPDTTRAAILKDIRAGEKSRGQIARDHEVSTTTVSKIAADAGIDSPFSREKTQKATEARVIDNKARRTQLASGSLEAAEEALAEIRKTLPGSALRDLAITYGVLIDKHVAIEKHDSGSGAEQAVSLLGAMFADMQGRHGDTPTE